MIDTKQIDDKIKNFEQEINRLKTHKNTIEMIINKLEEKLGDLETEITLYDNNNLNLKFHFNKKQICIFFDKNIFDIYIQYRESIAFTDFNKVVNYIIEELEG